MRRPQTTRVPYDLNLKNRFLFIPNPTQTKWRNISYPVNEAADLSCVSFQSTGGSPCVLNLLRHQRSRSMSELILITAVTAAPSYWEVHVVIQKIWQIAKIIKTFEKIDLVLFCHLFLRELLRSTLHIHFACCFFREEKYCIFLIFFLFFWQIGVSLLKYFHSYVSGN